MKELLEYREKLLRNLLSASKSFRDDCLAVKDVFAPLEEGGWNTHEVAAHTRDVDQLVYGMRVRRTAVEKNPEFQGFEPDTHNAEHYNPNEPLADILNELVASVESLVEMLRGLPGDAHRRSAGRSCRNIRRPYW